MRRKAVAVIGVGCAMGMFAAGSPSSASASASGRSEASNGVHNAGAPATVGNTASVSKLKTVEYDGYSITVPASWQVFNLETDPDQCVRYDINAVYLGNPGANQNCPPNLIGRAQTITITAAGVSGATPSQYQKAAVAHGGLGGSLPPSSQGTRVASIPSTLSKLNQYSQQHTLMGTVSHSDVSVEGTYGGNSSQVENIIRTIRKLPQQPSATSSASASATISPTASAIGSASADTPARTAEAPNRTLPIQTTSTPKPTPTPTVQTTAKPASVSSAPKPDVPSSPLNGFDTCTAPSVNAMKAWKSSYSAIGIYIGGQDMACDYGNLSASWVKSVHSMGWSLLPLYVGLQAPCESFPSDIVPGSAASEGTAAAKTAVADAGNFGLGKGSPIYYDMESYNNSNASCHTAVLTFLDAWTRELHTLGYVSGVYSSASTGVTDLVKTTTIGGHSLAEPDALWFALWDNNNNLTGTPYLPASRWASDRVKQYWGNETKKIGGYTISIDADRIGGAVSAP